MPAPVKAISEKQKTEKQLADAPTKVQNKKTVKNIPQTNKTVTPDNIPKGNSTGKLYFRTLMLTSAYGSSLEISWIFLGNNGTLVRDPKHGVNPINYQAESADNANNIGKYKIAGNKLNVTWQNGQTEKWDIEYDHGELSAVDGGLVCCRGERLDNCAGIGAARDHRSFFLFYRFTTYWSVANF